MITLNELISETKAGSIAAEQALYNRLAGSMFILCRRYVKNPEDAQERMQDGFCKFFMGIRDFNYKGEGAAISWINTIMVNECLTQLRKKGTFSLMTEAEAEDVPSQDNVLDELSGNEIYRLVLTLPTGCRTIFNLYVMEGYKHNEISGKLNITEATSRTQLLHARKLLQKLLKQMGHEHGKKFR